MQSPKNTDIVPDVVRNATCWPAHLDLIDRRRRVLTLLMAEVALRPEDRPIPFLVTAAGHVAAEGD